MANLPDKIKMFDEKYPDTLKNEGTIDYDKVAINLTSRKNNDGTYTLSNLNIVEQLKSLKVIYAMYLSIYEKETNKFCGTIIYDDIQDLSYTEGSDTVTIALKSFVYPNTTLSGENYIKVSQEALNAVHPFGLDTYTKLGKYDDNPQTYSISAPLIFVEGHDELGNKLFTKKIKNLLKKNFY